MVDRGYIEVAEMSHIWLPQLKKYDSPGGHVAKSYAREQTMTCTQTHTRSVSCGLSHFRLSFSDQKNSWKT